MASYKIYYLGQETGHSSHAGRGENFVKILFPTALPKTHKLSFKIPREATNFVGEKIHWESDAIAGNFIFE